MAVDMIVILQDPEAHKYEYCTPQVELLRFKPRACVSSLQQPTAQISLLETLTSLERTRLGSTGFRVQGLF